MVDSILSQEKKNTADFCDLKQNEGNRMHVQTQSHIYRLMELQEEFSEFRGYEGRNLLHLAAMEGDLAAVKALVSKGANIHVVDQRGDEPLKIAMMHGHAAVASYLKRKGACLSAEACADLGHRL